MGMNDTSNEQAWNKYPWSNAQKEQEVYLEGTHMGYFYAYGPHTVHNVKKRTLENRAGVVFPVPMEELLIKR